MSATTSAPTLAKLFEYTYNTTVQNVSGFGHEESLAQPKLGGNCLNWVVGHMVATRNLILDLLGQERVWDEKRFARYDRGSAPIADDTDAAPWNEILADLDRSQERIRAGIYSGFDGSSIAQTADFHE